MQFAFTIARSCIAASDFLRIGDSGRKHASTLAPHVAFVCARVLVPEDRDVPLLAIPPQKNWRASGDRHDPDVRGDTSSMLSAARAVPCRRDDKPRAVPPPNAGTCHLPGYPIDGSPDGRGRSTASGFFRFALGAIYRDRLGNFFCALFVSHA